MKTLLLLLLALLIQPAPPPPTLVLLVPEAVQVGEGFRVNAVVFGEGGFDILLGLGAPMGLSTQDDLIRSVRVTRGNPAILCWRVRAGPIPGLYTIMIHTADVPAVVRTVRVEGATVWLPLVGR